MSLAIVDDCELVTRGLATMLSSYADQVELVAVDPRQVERPVDIVLYDIAAQAPTAAEHGLVQLQRNPCVGQVVVYTWSPDSPRVQAVSTRRVSVLSKALPAERLVPALRSLHVASHLPPVHPSAGGVDAHGPSLSSSGLTEREVQIIALIAQGLSNAEIAEATALSINSIKSHIRTGYKKIGVSSRTQAVLWGLGHGL